MRIASSILIGFIALLLVQAIAPASIERPRDPWVFRSVLDGRARMVTIALDDDLWVAYDAINSGLYKAWKGGVLFDGSVYTSNHGPQPTSQGLPYMTGDVDHPVWRVLQNGRPVNAKPIFKGYLLEDEQVTLRYAVPLENGATILVEETPEFVRGSDGRPGLQRTFRTEGVPQRTMVLLGVEAASLMTETDLFAENGTFDESDRTEQQHEWGTTLTIAGNLMLRANDTTTLTTYFAPEVVAAMDDTVIEEQTLEFEVSRESSMTIPATLKAPVIDGMVDALWSGVPQQQISTPVVGEISSANDLAGQVQLLYDADNLYALFTVADDIRVNDSSQPFQDDAVEIYLDGGNEKVNFYDDNDVQYIFGAGDDTFWVSDSRDNHPNVAFATDDTDFGYRIEVRIPWANLGVSAVQDHNIGIEFHVDDDDAGGDADAALAWFSTGPSYTDPSVFATAILGPLNADPSAEAGPREPGAAVRLYAIGRSMAELMQLVPGQTPNVSYVVPQVDLITPSDFGGLEDFFITEVTGFITAAEAGTYGFRLYSDDGSRLWIDNQEVVENDGLHDAASPREGLIELTAGEHAFRIRHFENGGGEQLTLHWRPPGASEFVVVPATVFSTQAGEVRVTAPGTKRVIDPSREGTPGDGIPLTDVHPAYDLMTVRADNFEPRVGGMDFLPDGRLVICAWEPDGGVYILDGVQGDDRNAITVKRIAAGLAEPLGLKVVDGDIFVLQKQELTQLIDHDGDEVTDEYRAIANGWGVTSNFHEFAFGLVYQDDHFYATLATAILPGGKSSPNQNPDRGRVIKIARDGSYEFVAQGLRTPNGIGIGVDNQIFIADNQGDWLPSSKILHLEEGAFFGNRSVDPTGVAAMEEKPPVVWLPQGEIGNSPSQPAIINDGPYAGQMIHGEVTHGGVKRVFVEKIEGAYQGAAFRFTQGLEAGINRLVWGPDGALYVGGVGSTGNWGQEGKKRYGLQRLKYNGTPVFEMLAVRAKTNGLEIEFTEPLAEGVGGERFNYEVLQWRYVPTEEYGGPKIDEETLNVNAALVSDDRRRVFLAIDGMKESHVVYLHLEGPFESKAGGAPWSTEAWYTLNQIPSNDIVEVDLVRREPNTLTEEERAAGFRLLFDGETLDGWRGYGKDTVPGGWRVEDGTLAFMPGQGGGDIMPDEPFDNFELRLEWKISEGGNSGIMFRVSEDYKNSYETGPEMQVLDNKSHANGLLPETSAGANYALHAPNKDLTRPVGTFNEIRLIVKGDQVEHWLNGEKIVAYTLWDADWEALVQASKFNEWPGYGRKKAGYIVLQDHGNKVWYRNIRIRKL